MALYPDMAPFADNRFDCCDLFSVESFIIGQARPQINFQPGPNTTCQARSLRFARQFSALLRQWVYLHCFLRARRRRARSPVRPRCPRNYRPQPDRFLWRVRCRRTKRVSIFRSRIRHRSSPVAGQSKSWRSVPRRPMGRVPARRRPHIPGGWRTNWRGISPDMKSRS